MEFNKKYYDIIEETVGEIESNLGKFPSEDRDNANSELVVTRNKLNKIIQASKIPASIGVFGESQVGKSFLIDKLIGDDTKVNFGDNDNKKFRDFNDDYSDSETTAVVTRVTSQRNENTPKGKVLLKIITLEDLLSVYINGYFLSNNSFCSIKLAFKKRFPAVGCHDSYFNFLNNRVFQHWIFNWRIY